MNIKTNIKEPNKVWRKIIVQN